MTPFFTINFLIKNLSRKPAPLAGFTALLLSGLWNLDPHHLNADPDPSFHFNAYPDLTFHFNVDPDPALHRDENLRPLVYCTDLTDLHFEPPCFYFDRPWPSPPPI
jgi:hypothetical protein